jgi:phosphatidylglycerophosphate synthase
MVMFLGHIAMMLEFFAIATGLVLVRLSKTDKGWSSLAGWVLVIFGILGVICTGYYMLQYFFQGDFAYAYPQMMMPGKPS